LGIILRGTKKKEGEEKRDRKPSVCEKIVVSYPVVRQKGGEKGKREEGGGKEKKGGRKGGYWSSVKFQEKGGRVGRGRRRAIYATKKEKARFDSGGEGKKKRGGGGETGKSIVCACNVKEHCPQFGE